MPKSSFVDFKAVKAAITMEQVLEHYGISDRFKKSGDSLSGPCPIHGGSNPTQFRMSISKNIWHCFSKCKHGGNVLDFIAKMEDVSIHAAALKAIEWFSLDPEAMKIGSDKDEEPPRQAPKDETARVPKPAPKEPTSNEASSTPNKPLKFRLEKLERAHPYLTERGLTLETVVDFGAGFCAKDMMADRFEEDLNIRRVRLEPPSRPAPSPKTLLDPDQQERRGREPLDHLQKFKRTLG